MFAGRFEALTGNEITIEEGTAEDAKAGDFCLVLGDFASCGISPHNPVAGLGEEGYYAVIDDKCVIMGSHNMGIYWGTITLLQSLKTGNGAIPKGRLRDYPAYQVRGFGIDVARKPVSMEMLYQIARNMSWYKMNDLTVHLNDNEILETSGLTDSAGQAMAAESAYGQNAFKAVQKETGCVGFSREGRDYSFDYVLPTEEWVSLAVEGEMGKTTLYVDGELVDTLGSGEPFTEYATFVFPLQRIGSTTNSFHGMIREIEVEADSGSDGRRSG